MLSQRKGGRGQRPYLSEEAQQEVPREVSTGWFRTAEEVQDWIVAKYSVSYKRSGVYGLLYRLRCSPKVPHPIPLCAARGRAALCPHEGLQRSN